MDAFGVDAYFKFKYKDKNGQPQICRVTFDLTADTVEGKNEKIQAKLARGGRYLADTILYLTGQENYVLPRDREKLETFADQIIEKFKIKIEQFNKLIR